MRSRRRASASSLVATMMARSFFIGPSVEEMPTETLITGAAAPSSTDGT